VILTGGPTITVVTHNVPPSLTDADAEAAIRTAANGADVVAGQEWSHWRDIVAKLTEFDSWYPDRVAPGALPILWRRDAFAVVNEGSDRVYGEDKTVKLEPGAGPDYQRAAWVNWVVLQHNATGKRLGFVNAHPLPSIQAGPIREHLHYLVVVRVAEVVARAVRYLGASSVVAVGDWNAQPRDDAMEPLQVNGWVCDTTGTSTLGSRSIDDFYRLGKTLEPVAQRTFATASDHDGAAVDYRIMT
jgi:hypothetical protein